NLGPNARNRGIKRAIPKAQLQTRCLRAAERRLKILVTKKATARTIEERTEYSISQFMPCLLPPWQSSLANDLIPWSPASSTLHRAALRQFVPRCRQRTSSQGAGAQSFEPFRARLWVSRRSAGHPAHAGYGLSFRAR